ncbi:hypothetical protein EV383_3623 [Pseudonocardia sediminis]|uniref:Uncharacterized protein n=1 Tax=Pseudonocardia sediminis TaxID=1397368 RepID=A0A4Q7UY54_PSEST|nr:hypothetical protein EV383_3623 [Pseudonocardia sediminis]
MRRAGASVIPSAVDTADHEVERHETAERTATS